MIGDKTNNAILFDYDPSGASAATAKADKLEVTGLAASTEMAKTDESRALKIKPRFEGVGGAVGLPPALLAGIASRESRCGGALDSTGNGDAGHAFGIMQIDRRSHTIQGEPDPGSEAHIQQAAHILKANFDEVKKKHPTWPEARQLQGAVAAYNFGVRNVQSLDKLDIGTTHDDYSNDVWARARFYAE